MRSPAAPVSPLKCFSVRHARLARLPPRLARVITANVQTISPQTAAVIGAGEHGLIAAVELQSRGYNTTVFESESSVVPIFNSVKLGEVYYDYLSIGLMPSGHFHGSETTPVLAKFAAAYNHFAEAFPAALTRNFLSLDSVTGTLQVPSFWASQLGKLLTLLCPQVHAHLPSQLALLLPASQTSCSQEREVVACIRLPCRPAADIPAAQGWPGLA